MRSLPVPTSAAWAICILVGLTDAALIFSNDFALVVDLMLFDYAVPLILLTGFSLYYASQRRTERLAFFTSAILYVQLYSLAIVILSYLLAATDASLRDDIFSRADIALGLDWTAWLAWVNAHPAFGTALGYAYQSSMMQVVLAVTILAVMKRGAVLSEYLNLFCITTIVTVALAGLFPAAGAYDFYQPASELYANLSTKAGSSHLEQFLGLRDGSFRAIDLGNMKGIITFPSFHTELAIITAWAFWTIRWLRYPAIALNALVVISTPTHGGHYFIDAIAGGVLAFAFILLHRPSIRAALAARLSPLGRLITVEPSERGEITAYDDQSIRNRPRQESGKPSAADPALVSETRG